MHAIELTGLAASFVGQSKALLALAVSSRREAVQAYWLNSRFRHDNWSQRLAAHRQAIQASGVSFRNGRWREIIPVMQEVLLSEPLTRCLAYHAAVLEEQANDSDFATLMRSTLAAHIEARHRCLHLIVFGQGISVEQAVKLNRLRRALENFTDQLLSIMPPLASVGEYCFDIAGTHRQQTALASDSLNAMHLKLHVAGLADNLWRRLQSDLDWKAANARLNHRLSQHVLDLLPAKLFDSFGVPKTLRHIAMERGSLESTGRSNDLVSPLVHPLNILLYQPRPECAAPKTKPRW